MSHAIAQRRRFGTAIVLGGIACAMVGLAFAAVPIYRWVCKITGYDGTTGTAEIAPGAVGDRIMTIRFDANVARGMPWRFAPKENDVSVRIGEQTLAIYTRDQPDRSAGHRLGDVQCDAGEGRRVFRQDRMLLFHRADAEAG